MRGITVTLYEQTQTETNSFGEPIITETPTEINNVLVGEPSTDDITAASALYNKVIRYMLGIPKGDTHDWKDKRVSWTDAYGIVHECMTFGFPITGVEANIPGPWHMKVRCEDYDKEVTVSDDRGDSAELPSDES